MDILEIAKQSIRAEAQAIDQLAGEIDGSFLQAVELLAGCRGHVVTSGIGTTGIIARRLAHLLCNAGCPALFLHAGDSLHGSSGGVKPEDVIVLFSKTGETKETCQLGEIVSRRGTPILALTEEPDSTLGRLSKVALKVKTPVGVEAFNGLMGIGNSLAMGAMCDALVVAILQLKGTPLQQFIQGHPGGIVQHLADKAK